MATIIGTAGNDTLTGPDGEANVINGNAGADDIRGGDLADTIRALGADDTLRGGAGDDTILIDDAADLLTGTILGQAGNDTLLAATAGATIRIGSVRSFTGIETIDLKNGLLAVDAGSNVNLSALALRRTTILVEDNTTLTATQGDDTIVFDGQNSRVVAAAGNDTISLATFAAAPGGTILGGAGTDTVELTGLSRIDTIAFGSIETLDGNGFDVAMSTAAILDLSVFASVRALGTVFGENGNEVLTLSRGRDRVNMIDGDDIVRSADGDLRGDSLQGAFGTDTLVNDSADDLLLSASTVLEGFERIEGGGHAIRLGGADLDLALVTVTGVTAIVGGAQAETVTGSAGDDTIRGGGGNDSIADAGGDDVVTGGAGADLLQNGLGADTFRYTRSADSRGGAVDVLTAFAAGTDRIDLSAIDAIAGGADDLFVFVGAAAFTAAGQVRAVDLGGGQVRIEASTDADSAAELEIFVQSVQGTIGAGDFIP